MIQDRCEDKVWAENIPGELKLRSEAFPPGMWQVGVWKMCCLVWNQCPTELPTFDTYSFKGRRPDLQEVLTSLSREVKQIWFHSPSLHLTEGKGLLPKKKNHEADPTVLPAIWCCVFISLFFTTSLKMVVFILLGCCTIGPWVRETRD